MSSQTSEMPLSESRNTRSQLYWNTLVRLPAQVINFAISLLVARILMPRDFGIMGITMMLIGYANLFTNFGFAEAIIQKNIHDRKILNSIFTFNLFVSSLLAGGFFLAAGVIADFFNTYECKVVIRVMSIVFIITALSIVPGAVLRRDMNFQAVAILDFIQALLMSAATLILAYKGFGYWALVYGQLVPLAVVSVLLCVKVRYFPFIYYNHILMKEIYNFGGWNFIRVQLLFLSQHIDRFMAGKFLGPVPLGFYDKALSLSATPNNAITMHINSVMFSSFSSHKDELVQLQESFKKGMALIALITFPIHVGLIVVAPYFVNCLLGIKWSPMIFPFQIILLGTVVKSLGGMATSLNIGVGEYRANTVQFFYAFLVFTFCCIIFLSKGINGIAVSFLIFSVTEILLLVRLSLKSIKLRWWELVKSLAPASFATIVMYLMTALLSNTLLKEQTILNMIFIVMIGALVYAAYLVFDQSLLTTIFKRQLKKDFLTRFMG